MFGLKKKNYLMMMLMAALSLNYSWDGFNSMSRLGTADMSSILSSDNVRSGNSLSSNPRDAKHWTVEIEDEFDAKGKKNDKTLVESATFDIVEQSEQFDITVTYATNCPDCLEYETITVAKSDQLKDIVALNRQLKIDARIKLERRMKKGLKAEKESLEKRMEQLAFDTCKKDEDTGKSFKNEREEVGCLRDKLEEVDDEDTAKKIAKRLDEKLERMIRQGSRSEVNFALPIVKEFRRTLADGTFQDGYANDMRGKLRALIDGGNFRLELQSTAKNVLNHVKAYKRMNGIEMSELQKADLIDGAYNYLNAIKTNRFENNEHFSSQEADMREQLSSDFDLQMASFSSNPASIINNSRFTGTLASDASIFNRGLRSTNFDVLSRFPTLPGVDLPDLTRSSHVTPRGRSARL